MVVSWFSAGVSSFIATYIERENINKILYTHIDDQHEDTMRFLKKSLEIKVGGNYCYSVIDVPRWAYQELIEQIWRYL